MKETQGVSSGMPHPLVLMAGVGAVGSWTARYLDEAAAVLCVDRDVVSLENIGVAELGGADPSSLLGRSKADVVAERFRGRGGRAQALPGDLRYRLTPGIVAALDAVFLSLDNVVACRDASASIWASARPGIPVLVVTSGGDADACWQVRVFESGGLCPICMMSATARQEATSSNAASCAAAVFGDAPRASAVAAEAAGRVGASLLARIVAGERSLVGCRLQRDGRGTAPWTVRMPEGPVAGCPIRHRDRERPRVESLDGGIDDLTVGMLADRALDLAGEDATFLLGPRAIPLAGFTCGQSRHSSAAPALLLPAAAGLARVCDCPGSLRPLGERYTIAARELLGDASRDGSLRAWGASPGDGFVVTGARATIELRCRVRWDELSRD